MRLARDKHLERERLRTYQRMASIRCLNDTVVVFVAMTALITLIVFCMSAIYIASLHDMASIRFLHPATAFVLSAWGVSLSCVCLWSVALEWRQHIEEILGERDEMRC